MKLSKSYFSFLFTLLYVSGFSQNTYFPNGTIHTKGDKVNGEYIEYFGDGIQIMVKCNYVNGEIEGDYYQYHNNGNVLEHGKYKNGKKSGEWNIWNRKGNISHIVHYSKGMKNGIELSFYSNGEIIRSNYLNDNLDGECILYDANGKITQIRNYSNGKKLKFYLYSDDATKIDITDKL